MGMESLNSSAVNSIQPQSKPIVTEGREAVTPEKQAGRINTLPKIAEEVGNGKGQASDEEIKAAISAANKRAHFGHTNAEFSYHEATKRISIKIVDNETNEVIREIQPEETLEMISKMWELAGIMVDEKR